MTTATFTARQFNQNPSAVKRAAAEGPVFVTDRGAETLVVLNITDYRQLVRKEPSAYEVLMSLPNDGFDIDFDPPRMNGFSDRPAEFD